MSTPKGDLSEETLEEKAKRQKKEKKEEEAKKKIEDYKELNKRREQQRKDAEETSVRLGKKKSQWYLNPYYLTFGLLGGLLIYVIIMLFLNQAPPLNKTLVIDDKKIEEHNQLFPWHQGKSEFWEGATLMDAKKILGSAFASHSNLNTCKEEEDVDLPESFDYRTEWPQCVLPVEDHKKTCAGSYAIALSQALAERICIASDEHLLNPLSAQELLSCDEKNKGCMGGYLNLALDYIVKQGLAEEKCFEYKGTNTNVTCAQMCENPTKTKAAAYCVAFADSIKKEIFATGPVVGTMEVYTDFLTYKSGIYRPGDDLPRFSGFLTVKIIGWGVEGEEQYWIVQNSWGTSWGEDGYAKIAIGSKLVFENYVYGIKTHEEVVKLQKKAQEKEQEQKKIAEAETQTQTEDIPDMSLDNETTN